MAAPPSLLDLPEPGNTLAGKYSIVRVIGEGGMGKVYEALHLRLRQRVAIKMLLPRVLEMEDVVARFEREGRMAAQLRSRNVARILDVDSTPTGIPYMVMEYLEGHDLDIELQQRGQLPIEEAVSYVCQACEAMEEAHGLGIVHRDLKPANLFLCPERNTRVVKVLDFGISKMDDESAARLTGTHVTVGTPLYMSPEQVRSAKDVDLRTDIWSLGVILFELLTGRPPFSGTTTGAAAAIVVDQPPNMREIRQEIPPQLEAIVLRALEKDPSRRFQDVASMLAALSPFVAASGMAPQSRGSGSRLAAPGSVQPGSVQEALSPTLHSASTPPPAALPRPARVSSSGGTPDTGPIASAATVAQSQSTTREKAPATSPGWSSRAPATGRKNTRSLLLVAAAVLIGGAFAAFLLVTRTSPDRSKPGAGTEPSAAPSVEGPPSASAPRAGISSDLPPPDSTVPVIAPGSARPPSTGAAVDADASAPTATGGLRRPHPSGATAPRPSGSSGAAPRPPSSAPQPENPLFLQ